MSIERCEQHNYRYDTDFLETCPRCLDEEAERLVNHSPSATPIPPPAMTELEQVRTDCERFYRTWDDDYNKLEAFVLQQRQAVWEVIATHIRLLKIANRKADIPNDDTERVREQMLSVDSELRRIEAWLQNQARKERGA